MWKWACSHYLTTILPYLGILGWKVGSHTVLSVVGYSFLLWAPATSVLQCVCMLHKVKVGLILEEGKSQGAPSVWKPDVDSDCILVHNNMMLVLWAFECHRRKLDKFIPAWSKHFKYSDWLDTLAICWRYSTGVELESTPALLQHSSCYAGTSVILWTCLIAQ